VEKERTTTRKGAPMEIYYPDRKSYPQAANEQKKKRTASYVASGPSGRLRRRERIIVSLFKASEVKHVSGSRRKVIAPGDVDQVERDLVHRGRPPGRTRTKVLPSHPVEPVHHRK